MLLFIDTEGAELMGYGRQAKPICEKNHTRHWMFDLFEVPLLSSVSPAAGTCRIREIIVTSLEYIRLDLSRQSADVLTFTRSGRNKPERRERVHAPIRSNGPVGAPIAATA